jgi:mycothiol synthase
MISREYADSSDLRLMQDALIRDYNSTETRIGDVAWQARYDTHYELSLEIRLWLDSADLIAWTWLRTRGGLDMHVAPHMNADERLWAELLDAVDATVEQRLVAGDELQEIYTWFTDGDTAMPPRLLARGFHATTGPGGHVLLADLEEPLQAPVLPSGYCLGWVADEEDVHSRVESHRAAFAPSDLTLPMYQRVRRNWPYRPELDRIIKSETGDVVACCLAWLDETNRAGLLEPISTHPAHQNRGLARSVTADALKALRDAGALTAQVGTSGPAALAAYTAASFRPWKREITYRKPVRRE